MRVKVKRIGGHSLPLPKYETAGASGFDLRATESTLIRSGARLRIPCGFAFEVPEGYEIQVRPRSGLSAKGIMVTFGTVDADYRGEVSAVLTNQSGEAFGVAVGDRVAQGVIAPVVQVALEEVEELTPTERGEKGWGSTGSK